MKMNDLIPKVGTNEFNDLASACFGGKPKQKNDYSALLQPVGTKQETIEEIAERYYEDEVSINAFINGYKLAQEQILGVLYEEITERRDYSASKMCEVVIDYIKQNK
jgi:hypothetical protein